MAQVVIYLIFLLCLSMIACDEQYTISTYPNPFTNGEACNLIVETAAICDPEQMLTEMQRTALIHFVKRFEDMHNSLPDSSQKCHLKIPKVGLAFSKRRIARDVEANPPSAFYGETPECFRYDGVATVLRDKWLITDSKKCDSVIMVLVSEGTIEIVNGNSTVLTVDSLKDVVDYTVKKLNYYRYYSKNYFDLATLILREILYHSKDRLKAIKAAETELEKNKLSEDKELAMENNERDENGGEEFEASGGI